MGYGAGSNTFSSWMNSRGPSIFQSVPWLFLQITQHPSVSLGTLRDINTSPLASLVCLCRYFWVNNWGGGGEGSGVVEFLPLGHATINKLVSCLTIVCLGPLVSDHTSSWDLGPSKLLISVLGAYQVLFCFIIRILISHLCGPSYS